MPCQEKNGKHPHLALDSLVSLRCTHSNPMLRRSVDDGTQSIGRGQSPLRLLTKSERQKSVSDSRNVPDS